jgi:hypothetical protein
MDGGSHREVVRPAVEAKFNQAAPSALQGRRIPNREDARRVWSAIRRAVARQARLRGAAPKHPRRIDELGFVTGAPVEGDARAHAAMETTTFVDGFHMVSRVLASAVRQVDVLPGSARLRNGRRGHDGQGQESDCSEAHLQIVPEASLAQCRCAPRAGDVASEHEAVSSAHHRPRNCAAWRSIPRDTRMREALP